MLSPISNIRHKDFRSLSFFRLSLTLRLPPLDSEKNAILLVLPFEEISIRPELSSPPRFRIQGGSTSVTDERTVIFMSIIECNALLFTTLFFTALFFTVLFFTTFSFSVIFSLYLLHTCGKYYKTRVTSV